MEQSVFARALTLYDDLLTVRNGPVVKQFVVERKAFVPNDEIMFLDRRVARAKRWLDNPPDGAMPAKAKQVQSLFTGASEEAISARRGARVIVIAAILSQQLLDQICLSDIQRYGGYARFADVMEKKEAQDLEKAERDRENQRHEMNREVASMAHFVWRKREDALLNGSRDMRYLVHGQHSKPNDRPLIQLTDF